MGLLQFLHGAFPGLLHLLYHECVHVHDCMNIRLIQCEAVPGVRTALQPYKF